MTRGVFFSGHGGAAELTPPGKYARIAAAGPRRKGAVMNNLRHAGHSDRGRTHPANEDRWLIDPDLGLFLVSDGMADPVAPQLVVDLLPGLLRAGLADVADLSGDR